ncbi:hypothetical protein LSTR_LSTR001630 [Laodelphax striatellus]|uniref:TELO2-interacting protein 1 homolog n=1 Tax=Laodelphax striatellus TaxID=195883 RepID=A0A482XD62_LAOST|nr:hypothetical protein LSTR_LSTR001630 [Laodelphax striatellus]
MEDEDEISQAFRLLKPVCDNIVTSPNRNNVIQLKNLISNAPKTASQRLQFVISFPLELHLFNNNSLSSEVKRYMVDALTALLLLTETSSIDKFVKIYSGVFKLLSRDAEASIATNVSEELKLSVLNCVCALFKSTPFHVLETLYVQKYHPMLSFGVFLCTKLVKEEKMIQLRVTAMKCILHVIQQHDEVEPTSNFMFMYNVSNVAVLMMPGIVSTAVVAACGGEVQNHQVTLMGLRLWGRTIALCLNDTYNMSKPGDNCDKNKINELCIDNYFKYLENNRSEVVPVKNDNMKAEHSLEKDNPRTEKWINQVSPKLEAVMKRIITESQSHNNYKVRLELVKIIDLLLSSSVWNMRKSLRYMIEALIVLSQDGMDLISTKSRESLAMFSRLCSLGTGKEFLELVEENFYSFMSSFPRLVLKFGNNEMILLNGYLEVLGPFLPRVLSSDNHLTCLITCLTQAVLLDTKSVPLRSELSLRDMESIHALKKVQWKYFVLNRDSDWLVLNLERICETLRKHADIPMLVYTLLDLLRKSEDSEREIMLILNSLVTTGAPGSMEKHKSLIKEVFNCYMDLPVWPASEVLDQKDAFNKQQMKVLQLCLAIEGMGKMSVAVGKEIFGPMLLHSLYAILEAAGSPLEVVAAAGLNAVSEIASVCSEGSITQLVRANTDYLSYQITRRLRQLYRHPGLLAVLSVIMRHSTKLVLPSLQEIFSDVLEQSYDVFQMNKVQSYLRAFFTFICCIRKWEEDERLNNKDIPINQKEKPVMKSPIEVLLDYKKSKLLVQESDSEEENTDSQTTEEKFRDESERLRQQHNLKEEDEEDDFTMNDTDCAKKQVPVHIQLVIDILKRSLNFLPTKDSQQQIIVIQVLEEGVLLLRHYQDQLLPVVHLIWSPLVNRFKSAPSEPLLMHRAFLLLTTLAATSKDFIRHDTLKSVLPSICIYLKETSHKSYLKDKKSFYRLSQEYKLQKSILEKLGPLALDLEVFEKNIYDILDATSPYLSCYQPQPLQDACISLYLGLSTKSCDLVWLHLLSIWSPEPSFVPCHPDLKSIELPEHPEDSEFQKNVKSLLSQLS